MDSRALILFLNTFANFTLGLIVWLRNKTSEKNIVFLIFASSISLWSFGLAMFYANSDQAQALIWAKLLYFGGSVIAVSLCYFSLIFPSHLYPIKTKLLRFYLITPSIFIFLITLYTNFVLSGVTLGTYKGLTFGFGNLFWNIHFLGFMSIAFFNLFLQLKKSIGMERLQVKYILTGTLTAALFGGLTNVILPTLGNFTYFNLGPLMTIFMAGLIAYTIIKHRFLDISLAIRGMLIFLSTSLLVSLITFIACLISGIFTPSSITLSNFISMVLIATLITALIPKISKASSSFWDSACFGRSIDYQQSLITLSEQLSKVLELSKLVDSIINALTKTMGLSKAIILIADYQTNKFNIVKNVGFDENKATVFTENNFLVHYLRMNQKIIVVEELKKIMQEKSDLDEKYNLNQLITLTESIGAGLIIPVTNNSKLISLIILGYKSGGDAYTIEDLKLLEIIASQSATAFENARLYHEIGNFNMHLKQKVDEATSQLIKNNEDLEKANIQVELSGKLKEDLLTMASHEFRTPISIIKSMRWMLQKRDFYTKLNDQDLQKFDRLSKSVDRLDYVVRNINQMLSATSGNFEEQLHFDDVQIEQIIEDVIEDKEIEAKDALINLSYVQPKNLLPLVEADPVKMQYVIYELITNAIKYTEKNGSINIITDLQNDNIVIKIADTGKGIPVEKIPTLFKEFDKIDVVHTTQSGMGLGLYIISKILKLHKGRIYVESEVGKGSTFVIELPVKKHF